MKHLVYVLRTLFFATGFIFIGLFLNSSEFIAGADNSEANTARAFNRMAEEAEKRKAAEAAKKDRQERAAQIRAAVVASQTKKVEAQGRARSEYLTERDRVSTLLSARHFEHCSPQRSLDFLEIIDKKISELNDVKAQISYARRLENTKISCIGYLSLGCLSTLKTDIPVLSTDIPRIPDPDYGPSVLNELKSLRAKGAPPRFSFSAEEYKKAKEQFETLVRLEPKLLPAISGIFLYNYFLSAKVIEGIDQIPVDLIPHEEIEKMLLKALPLQSYRDQLEYVEQLKTQKSPYASPAEKFVASNLNRETFSEISSQVLEAYKRKDSVRASQLIYSFRQKGASVKGARDIDNKSFNEKRQQLFDAGLELLREQHSTELFDQLNSLSQTED